MDEQQHRIAGLISRLAIFATLIFTACVAGADTVGKLAPPLTGNDLQQRNVSLAELRGQPVLVMFWATWCGPCRKEMPLVQAAYDNFRDKGFTVIAVNVSDDHEDVADYAKEMGVEFPIILDPRGDTAERFGVIGLPTNYVIDAAGTVRDEIIGGDLNDDRLKKIIRKYGRERKNDRP